MEPVSEHQEEFDEHRKKMTRDRFEKSILDPLFAAWCKEVGIDPGPHQWSWDNVASRPSSSDHPVHQATPEFSEGTEP